MRARYAALFSVAFFALIFAANITRIDSLDAGWHVRTGEYIFVHHEIPFRDTFSHTAQGGLYLPTHWLFSLLLFLVYKMAGVAGMTLFQAVIVTLAFYLLYLTAKTEGADPVTAVAVLILVYLASRYRFTLRPELFTFLFLAAFCLILEAYKKGGKLWLYLLPAVAALWANLHAGVIFGLILLALFVLGEPLASTERLKLACILLLTALASSLNPTGFGYVGYVLSHIGIYEKLGILEFRPTSFWSNPYFWIYVFVLGASLLSRFRSATLFELLIFASFGWVAAMNFRMVPVFMIVTSPILARGLIPAREGATPLKKAALGLIAAASFFSLLVSWRETELRSFGFGLDGRAFPVKCATFIEREKLAGEMYNDIQFGGYLIWRLYPRYRVFLDGRLALYGDIYKEFAAARSDRDCLEEILEKRGVSFALAAYPHKRKSDFPDMGRFFSDKNGWPLVYWDDAAMLFVKDIPENRDIIERFGFAYGSPVKSKVARDELPRAIEELKRRAAADPDVSVTHLWLAALYLEKGDCDSTILQCERALEIFPSTATPYYYMAISYMKKGDLDTALSCVKKALRYDPSGDDIWNLGGVLYAEVGDFKRAQSYWTRALKISPSNTYVAQNLRRILCKK